MPLFLLHEASALAISAVPVVALHAAGAALQLDHTERFIERKTSKLLSQAAGMVSSHEDFYYFF